MLDEPKSSYWAFGTTIATSSLASVAEGENVIGISQYDPTAKGRPAWNAGKQVGVKLRHGTCIPFRSAPIG